MAKKERLNAKDRAAAKMAEKAKWQAKDQEKELQKQLEEERIQLENEAKKTESEFKEFYANSNFSKEKDVKKSSAKAAGLKSAFTLKDNEVLITSFGRGNEAIIEKKISATGEISSLSPEAAFELKGTEKKNTFAVIGRTVGTVDNPQSKPEKTANENIVRTKSALEKQYFGKTFDDNIHIQLIQSILDIKKILAVHTNNIVYALNNIQREKYADKDPIGIGIFDLNCSFEDFKTNPKKYSIFKKFISLDNLSYFGDAFYRKPNKKEMDKYENKKDIPKKVRRSEWEIYDILCLVNELRQVCVHNTEFGNTSSRYRSSNIYNFASKLSQEAKDVLDRLYSAKLQELNSFEKNASKNNFAIIFDLLNVSSDEDKKQIAQDYYNFAIRKNYKNIGFSIKTLREAMISACCEQIKDESLDSVRSKLYGILDFVIYNYYDKNLNAQNELIGKLRSADKNENKARIYYDETVQVYSQLESKIKMLVSYCKRISSRDAEKFPLSEEDKLLVKSAIAEISLSSNVSYFSKFIYLLTLFLDGKEINDLLTTLINKFDNIASFETVLKKQIGEVKFVEQFEFFDSSNFLNNDKSLIVSELTEINSFARMGEIEVFKKSAYKEAAYLLGTKLSDEEIEEYIDSNFIDKTKLPKTRDRKGRIVTDAGKRNFLINNVLKSRRFNYLVRYADPYKIRKCIENEAIVRFVLKNMDDNIIDRYFKVCCTSSASNCDEKINALVDLLCNQMSIDFATDVNQKAGEKDKNKQAKRAIVSLYLNVLYQVAKNMVYINSRYVMAFHSLERDLCLHNLDSENYIALTQKALEEKWLNKHARNYLSVNLNNCDDWALTVFRDKTAHLNAIRKIDENIVGLKRIESYFELYHYIMQHEIVSTYKHKVNSAETNSTAKEQLAGISDNTKRYLSLVEKNSWYVKDFVKALCVPFGYNLSRYKNLSIDILFDRNETREHKKVKIED